MAPVIDAQSSHEIYFLSLFGWHVIAIQIPLQTLQLGPIVVISVVCAKQIVRARWMVARAR